MAKKKKQIVVKGNELIQDASYNLSETALNVFNYICHLANNTNPAIKEVVNLNFTYGEYFKFYKKEHFGGKDMIELQKALKELMETNICVTSENELQMLPLIYDKSTDTDKNHEISINLTSVFIPYLCNIQKTDNYTEINVLEYKALSGKYSKRLFEMLISYHDCKIRNTYKRSEKERKVSPRKVEVSLLLNYMKCCFGIAENSSYNQYKFFKQNILQKGIEEINDNTSYCVSYEEIKKGRAVETIKFTISQKGSLCTT